MTTPQAVRPRLRPLSVGEILDVAIKICLAHWRTLIKAVLVVVVPVQVVSTLLTADYTVDSFDFGASSAQTSEESLEELNQYLGGLAISGVLQICAVLLATAACFRAIAQAYLGERTDWRSSLAYALRLAPALLVLTLLYVGGVALGTIALLAPGVWLAIAWAFALPALLVEDVRGARALGRSFRLVKGRWWRTFGVILVGFVLATVVSTVVQAVFFVGIFADADNDVLVLVLSAIAGIVGLAITTPFQAALVTVVYFDLRVRKEGFDLELLAQGIGERAPAAGAGAQSGPAPAPVLPPQEQVDRSAAPFWPPPPGWRPSGGDGTDEPGEGTGDEPRRPDRSPDEPPDEPPRQPGVPSG